MANFVLVPGAWLGSWAWKKVTPLLQAQGHKVFPVTLTGMGDRVHLASREHGMETAIQDVLNVVEYNDIDEFILVGHSFAGKVAAAVADRVPDRVKLLLYLDAARPEKKREPQGGFDPSEEFGPLPPGGFAIPFSEEILDAIGSDIKGENRKWMMSKATPWPIGAPTGKITLSERFDAIKSAYIFCTLTGDPVDEIIAGKWGKLYGPYRIMETGHWPMISRPEELVKDMLELVESALK